MKKILFAIAIVAFLLGCANPSNISINTSQNQTPQNGGISGGSGSTTQPDDPNAKTILTLQNNSSVPLENIKYNGKETESLVPGGSWQAKFIENTQGYINFSVLGTEIRTNEPVIIKKDKKFTYNITDSTLVIGLGGKPGLMPLLQLYQQLNGGSPPPQQGGLEGGLFFVAEKPSEGAVYYSYFLNGTIYEVINVQNRWQKYVSGMTYSGNTIHYDNGYTSQITITPNGIILPDGMSWQRITDPQIANIIKNLQVSSMPVPPQQGQSLEGKVCTLRETADGKQFLCFLNGRVYRVYRQNGNFTNTADTGMTYQGTALYTAGVPESLIITNDGIQKQDGTFWRFLNAPEFAEEIKNFVVSQL